ncbi:hypothetical protein INR49_004206 [Caranx melampygus]|nr:hypothetical protein INR49_004206 [Caranx melampygus]
MSHNGAAPTRRTVTVVALVEEWSSLKSLLQESAGEGDHRPPSAPWGQTRSERRHDRGGHQQSDGELLQALHAWIECFLLLIQVDITPREGRVDGRSWTAGRRPHGADQRVRWEVLSHHVICSSTQMRALLEMIEFTLAESGTSGYTEAMLVEARTRSTEDSAMTMLKQKVREAEQKEQAFRQLVLQQEERRTRRWRRSRQAREERKRGS